MSCDIRRSNARTRSLTPGECGSPFPFADMMGGRTSMPSSAAGSSDGRSGGSGVAGVYGGGGGGRCDSDELSSVRVEMYEGSPRT